MKEFYRQGRWTSALAALSLFALTAATGCGGGGNSEKQYTLAGRVVNGNPYRGVTEPRPGATVLVSRSAGTYNLPGGGTDERFESYKRLVADANGSFSLRVPAGLYLLRTIPPLGGDPNDGITTPDDICSSQNGLRFPENEGETVTVGHDFCNELPQIN